MSATFQLRRAMQQVMDAWQPTDPTAEDNENRQAALNVLNNADATDDELIDALDEFTSSVPGQTKDCDWWSDELRSAVNEADDLLSDLLDGEPQYLQGEIN